MVPNSLLFPRLDRTWTDTAIKKTGPGETGPDLRSCTQTDREKQTGRQGDKRTERQRQRQTSRQTEGERERERKRPTNRQTDRQTSRQAGRQAGRHTHTHTRTGRKASKTDYGDRLFGAVLSYLGTLSYAIYMFGFPPLN